MTGLRIRDGAKTGRMLPCGCHIRPPDHVVAGELIQRRCRLHRISYTGEVRASVIVPTTAVIVWTPDVKEVTP